jgi:hypothetical protein
VVEDDGVEEEDDEDEAGCWRVGNVSDECCPLVSYLSKIKKKWNYLI